MEQDGNTGEGGGIDFPDWLSNRLKQLKTDESVMCPYITSILEEEDEREETVEALDGILGEIGTGGVAEIRNEILSKWNLFLNQAKAKPITTTPSQVAESDQLNEIFRIAAEVSESSSCHRTTEPDAKLRAAILSIANGSDSEDDEECVTSSANQRKKKQDTDSHLATDFGRNSNAEKVLNEQKEVKDRAKAESIKKKERDKEDRAKQKASNQDRKDKAKKKAAKVERKR